MSSVDCSIVCFFVGSNLVCLFIVEFCFVIVFVGLFRDVWNFILSIVLFIINFGCLFVVFFDIFFKVLKERFFCFGIIDFI